MDKGTKLAEALFVICLLALFPACRDSSANTQDLIPVMEREIPGEIKEYANSKDTEWMVGMWVELGNCKRLEADIANNVDSYEYHAGEISATVIMQNCKDEEQPFRLMLLADGVPTKFQVGKREYVSYCVNGLIGALQMDIVFLPEFINNLGRLDFLLLYDGNPASDFYMTSYQIWMEQSSEYHAEDVDDAVGTTRAREKDIAHGEKYTASLRKDEANDPTCDASSRKMTIMEDEKILLTVTGEYAGRHRIVCLADERVIDLENGSSNVWWIDWNSNGDDAYECEGNFPLGLPESFSFYTICTPIDKDKVVRPCMASYKIPIKIIKK